MSESAPDTPLPEPMFYRLRDLHRTLLHLHKTLMEGERESYERTHGKVTKPQLLQLLLTDKQFEWLRAISQLIVSIDELMDPKDHATEHDAKALLQYARNLLVASETGDEFQRKLDAALQSNMDAVFAHKDVRQVLTSQD